MREKINYVSQIAAPPEANSNECFQRSFARLVQYQLGKIMSRVGDWEPNSNESTKEALDICAMVGNLVSCY